MPLQATAGAASYDAFGGGVAAVPNYIEDVFSTWLYTGNGSTQTITNGIDLAGKGGLVWIKSRSAARPHGLFDTARGDDSKLSTNSTAAASTGWAPYFDFNSNGFGFPLTDGDNNASGATFASWTFREQAKFFDVVTYTGDGAASRSIPHSLGSVPGCIIVKATNAADDWYVYHRGTTAGTVLYLNLTNAATVSSMFGTPTSTDFVVTTGGAALNVNGRQYVAYLFAHNAGGFGLTGTDNVISCGSFTANASGAATVNLGYEPQWILYKSTASSDWYIYDNMRGWAQTDAKFLIPNTSGAEQQNASSPYFFFPTATGFQSTNDWFAANQAHIYIAIRRGPMKVPTTGTSVFAPVTSTSTGLITAGFPVDLTINRTTSFTSPWWVDRLRSVGINTRFLQSSNTNAEDSTGGSFGITLDNNVGLSNIGTWGSGSPAIYWNFRRAPGFFDEVCWTGDNTTNRSISHNLQAAPELIIRKSRSASGSWSTLTKFETSNYIELSLNSASEGSVRSYAANQYLSAKPTSTVFTVNSGYENDAGVTYVSYLFATCPGVSKVGFYTGTGTTQTINCGFTTGSRFVLIKRYDPDSSGDWYVWDSARGIVAGNDPYLLLNSTAAEVTNTDFVDTAATGFEISSTAPAAINASGGTYIFLAIA